MKKTLILTLILALLLCGTQALASVMVVTGTPTYDDSEGMAQNLARVIETLNNRSSRRARPSPSMKFSARAPMKTATPRR